VPGVAEQRRVAIQELGVPTANICSQAIGSVLSEAVTGIYYGWASVGTKSEVHKMVMSVGFNPFFGNTVKTCEPWLLSTFPEVREWFERSSSCHCL
jgi:FAD synthase